MIFGPSGRGHDSPNQLLSILGYTKVFQAIYGKRPIWGSSKQTFQDPIIGNYHFGELQNIGNRKFGNRRASNILTNHLINA